MQTDTATDKNRVRTDTGRRFIFTRMVPTAVIVFFILFTFFPDFGSPIANLRSLGQGGARLSSEQKQQNAFAVATGLQQLQASGQLGSYLQVSSGGVSEQTLSWDGQLHLLAISNGNTVDLSGLVAVSPAVQSLAKSANTLSLSGSTTTVDLGSYLDNTDAQTVGLAGTVLTISGGNTIDLAPINTDSQTLSLSGSSLSISGGNAVNLTSINTDVLASLSCAVGQIAQWNGTAWVCASPSAASDAQTLNLSGNNLSILNGNSVSLAGYLDNTDSQTLSLGSNTLSLVNGGSVNLAAYLDNTDVLAGLACGTGQIAKWNGSAWACAADSNTATNETQVDAWVSNNGYLTSEVDGSTTNELQTLSWNSGTRILTISSGNTADLGSLLDNTDAQAISRTGNTISITGNASTVDLSSYLDNTDAQAISKTGNTLSITGSVSTVDLASYLDNTDSQTLSLAGSTLTVSGGNSINLAPINTDSQNLSLSGTTLNISGGTGVNIASINTDVLAGLSCSTSQIAKWNGTAWACAADVDTDTVLSEAQVDAYAGNNGYLTAETDGSITNEIQSLSLVADVLSISGSNNVNLSAYLDNTDAQALSYSTGTHVMSISGNAGTIDLSNLLDNTDSQAISKTGNTLSISGNAGTVDLAGYLDNTDVLASLSCTTGQFVQWNGSAWVCITPSAGTDSQNLSLASNTLSISNGNSVSLAGYLDNTDTQAISVASNVLSISGNAGTVDLSSYLDNTDSQALSLGGNTLSLVNGGSVSLAAYLDNTDVLASLGCTTNQIAKWNGTAWACAADVDTQLSEAQVDSYANNNGYLTSEVDGSTSNELQTLSWNSGTHILTISGGNTADLGSLLDNTDAQAISKTGNTLSISGNASTVDLASYLDNTDSQTLSLAGSTLTVSGGNSIDLAPINTDAQDLSLSGTTLNISGGTGVNIASINTDVLAGLSCTTNQIAKWNGTAWACAADVDTDTDAQTLSLASNSLSILGGNSVSLAGYLDNTDTQTLGYNTGTHVLSISGGNTADLSNLLDNTDSQAISKSGNTLSISGNAGTVDLASYLDNTDVLAGLSCTTNQIAKWNGTAWACAADVDTDTVLSEAQVDAYANNNGYLTSEVDGSTTNEIQDLSLSGDTLSLSSDGTTVDLSAYMDDTDSLAALSCIDGKIVKRTGGVWACGDDANTTYSAGTGIAIDGSNVISSSLGTSIDSAEIVDGTIATADVADGAITNVKLATSSLTVTAGTGLTGGGTVSLGGTVTLNLANDFGASIDSGEITDGTIATADLATGAVTSGAIADGTIATVDLAGGSVTAAKLANCTSDGQILKYTTAGGWACGTDVDSNTTYSAGTGIAIDGSNVISSSLGTSIDSSEITDGTIAATDIADATLTFAKLAGNSCGTGSVIKFNGSAWYCGTDIDTDTQPSESTIESYIFDGDNTGTLSSGTLALGSLSYTGELADANISDALTISSSGSVADGALSSNVTKLGQTIESSEITNGTILFADLNQNACTNSQVIKWDSTANAGAGGWVCGTDATGGGAGNSFETITTPGGTSPVADSSTDTLSLAGSGITITGNSTTDTITFALTNDFGSSIDSSEITDGTIAAADIADATITLAKLGQNSCNDGQVIKWSTASTAWICAADTDTDTVLSEAQVDAYANNNGYLTSEVDGSTTNEIQDLSLSGNTLALSDDGTTVDLSSYLDDTDTLAALSCSPGQVAQWNGTAWACTTPAVDTDTQDLSLVGDTLSLVNGGSVDLSAYMDDTVLSEAQVDAYANNNGYLTSEVDGSTTNELQNIFQTVATPDANNPSADGTADTLTLANGSGVTISSNGTTDTITIATTLGTDITSSEIVDGTVANADLANSSLTVSAGTGLTGGGAVSLGGTVTLSLTNDFGASIDSGEITNGTLAFADLGQNGCNDGDVIKWSSGSTAWTCGTDNLGSSVNSFATVTTPAGTSPVADSSTDTLTFSGTGITITGNSATDTIALALTNDFGASIDSSEITDGTIVGGDISDGSVANADLANASLTISAGNGLTNGGSVSLGGTTTLNIGAGNGITVNADDIAVKPLTTADALSSTTSSGAGVEVLASGVGLLQGCADTQILKWNETTDVWACAADNDTIVSEATVESYIFDGDNTGTLSSGTLALGSLGYTGALTDTNVADTLTVGATSTVSDSALSANVTKLGTTIESSEITNATIAAADIAPDALDFTEFKDAMALDATTAIALGANDFNINLDSTGTFNVQDGGTSVLSVLADGTFKFQNSADSATSFVINDATSLPMLTVDTAANSVEIGTLVDDAADVLLVLDGVSGADPTGVAGGMYYNTTNNKFRCYQGTAWVDCVPAAYNEYTFVAGLDTWTNMPAAETQFLNTPIRLQVDLTRASEFRVGISRMAGVVTAGADCRVQYAATQAGVYANLDGGTGPEVDISGVAELKSSAWTAIAGAAKSDVYLRIMCKQGNGVDDPQFRKAYIQVR
jgi:hypothetical protein